MSNLSTKEQWLHLKHILMLVKEGNDKLLPLLQGLHIVLINLKIEEAHISADCHINTGIVPICNEIERLIDIIEKNMKDVTRERRLSLECIDALDKYFKDI